MGVEVNGLKISIIRSTSCCSREVGVFGLVQRTHRVDLSQRGGRIKLSWHGPVREKWITSVMKRLYIDESVYTKLPSEERLHRKTGERGQRML